jgi:uncharacterized protein YaaQ
MQLMLAIVQSVDAGGLTDRLVQNGLRITRVRTAGSFLHLGNETLLIGVEDEQVQGTVDLIRGCCHTRRQFVSAVTSSLDALPVHTAVEVEVGGATIFVLPVERFIRLGREVEPGSAPESHAPVASEGDAAMKLMIAVVHRDLVDRVTDALLQASYRVTRIDSTGGFLRRGNGTLLIGVESDKVDDVLRLMREVAPKKVEAAAPTKGMPMYSVTIFVLDAPTFLRV